MRSYVSVAVFCLVALVPSACFAASEEAVASSPAASTEVFSTSALPDAPGREETAFLAGQPAGAPRIERSGMRPFSALGVAIKFGLGGPGFDLATPLGNHFNLRGGATFFNYSPSLTADGLTVNGTIDFRTVDAHLDWFPWAGRFHLSPGVTLYNGNHLNAAITAPAGKTFSLNSVSYTSDPTGANPVTGTFDLTLGNKVAPSLLLGWGNLIPRRPGSHWSVPFEIGFEYINTPKLALALNGTACGPDGCHNVATDPATQANIAQEQAILQNDISALRVYPMISIGVGYKFGR